jgi:hypothetical protein
MRTGIMCLHTGISYPDSICTRARGFQRCIPSLPLAGSEDYSVGSGAAALRPPVPVALALALAVVRMESG